MQQTHGNIRNMNIPSMEVVWAECKTRKWLSLVTIVQGSFSKEIDAQPGFWKT